MILGFKDVFVPYVEDGSKTHTIRGGDRWKVGVRADLYVKPRQKGMRLIFRAPVVRVEAIEFRVRDIESSLFAVKGSVGVCVKNLMRCPLHERVSVLIDDEVLDEDERNLLAYRDGFRNDPALAKIGILRGCFAQMVQFWAENHGLGRNVPFHGQIVHWDYSARFMDLKA